MNKLIGILIIFIMCACFVGCVEEKVEEEKPKQEDYNWSICDYNYSGETRIEIFYLPNCGGCRIANPTLVSLIKSNQSKYDIKCYIPIGDNEVGIKKARDYNITYVPSVVINNGEVILRGYEEVIRIGEYLDK